MNTEINKLICDLGDLKFKFDMLKSMNNQYFKTQDNLLNTVAKLKVISDFMEEGAKQLLSFLETEKRFIDTVAPKDREKDEIYLSKLFRTLSSESLQKYAKDYDYTFPND